MALIGNIMAIIMTIINAIIGVPAHAEEPQSLAYTEDLPQGAYNITQTDMYNGTSIDYNIVNEQGDVCTITTTYYNDGSAASSQRC